MDVKDKLQMGLRIKKSREQIGLSQEKLAESLGMKRTNIANYEAGRVIPPGNVIKQLADILDVTADYLLGRTNTKKAESDDKSLLKELEEDPDFMVAYKEYPGSPEDAKEDLIGFLKLIKQRDERKRKK